MAVKRLHFVLRRWHLLYKRAKAIRALKRLAVPHQRGRRTIKVRQIGQAGAGVVGGIEDAGEVLSSAGCNFDAGRLGR
jgi:hypothetical protein